MPISASSRRSPSSPPTGATSSSPMWSRKGSATSSATSRSRATSATSAPSSCAPACRCAPATGTTPSRSRTRSPSLNELAGLFGYAFADVRPTLQPQPRKPHHGGHLPGRRDAARLCRADRHFSGNTTTRDKVIRREFRLAEGDPFNNVRVRRSRDRIQSLGFFQENLEIQQKQGSAPDRVVLGVEVEERATGELQLSAGFSSLERFLVNLSVRAAQLHGPRPGAARLGQLFELFQVDRARLHRALSVRPQHRDRLRHLPARPQQLQLLRRTAAPRPIEQTTTGGQIRIGVPLTEKLSLALRYGLNYDEIGLNQAIYFTDPDGAGPLPRGLRSAASPAAICATRSATG